MKIVESYEKLLLELHFPYIPARTSGRLYFIEPLVSTVQQTIYVFVHIFAANVTECSYLSFL